MNETISLNSAGHVREYGVGVRTNQANGSNHDDENDSNHYGVFRDVLTGLV
jgi:hypothetical protein